jgi:hypothetical protein
MQTPRLVVLAASLAVMSLSAQANDTPLLPVQDMPLLELIGTVEGPDGYDDITQSTSLRPPIPITRMTLREVMKFQDLIVSSGSNSSAMGRYQFIRSTLAGLVDDLGLDEDVLFDRRTQDYLARRELIRCGFYERSRPDTRVANCLARTWAALPVVSGPNVGMSHYDGKAGNQARASVSEFMDVVSLRFDARPVRMAVVSR